MDILRFITAGNVDDGKSTLIGRLLYDTHNIKSDVLDSVSGGEDSGVNLAHITDGLRSEREQGITIDVAYKYFTTPQRKYIITDAPGHFRYTKNLVTGASGVDAMIILIDAQNGITEQTRRHSLVASFLKIKHLVVAINKMDLLAYDEQVFNNIRSEFLHAGQLQLPDATFIPISALCGDNVSVPSHKMEWYKGMTLMQYLETCAPVAEYSDRTRFTVQCEIVADKAGFEKGYAGKILSGRLKVGEQISVYPAGTVYVIRKIISGYNEVTEVGAGQNITVYLENDVAVKRGDILAPAQYAPVCSNHFEATLCWLNGEEPLQTGADYILRINGVETVCKITEVVYKTDISTFEQYTDALQVAVNQFARVRIETRDVIAYDPFPVLPENGRGIIIDARTNYTSGAFVVTP